MRLNRVAIVITVCTGQTLGMAGMLLSLFFKQIALIPIFVGLIFVSGYIANRACRADKEVAISFQRLRPYHWSLFLISGVLMILVLPRIFY